VKDAPSNQKENCRVINGVSNIRGVMGTRTNSCSTLIRQENSGIERKTLMKGSVVAKFHVSRREGHRTLGKRLQTEFASSKGQQRRFKERIAWDTGKKKIKKEDDGGRTPFIDNSRLEC